MKIEFAKTLLADGVPIEKIDMYTGLTHTEIETICKAKGCKAALYFSMKSFTLKLLKNCPHSFFH